MEDLKKRLEDLEKKVDNFFSEKPKEISEGKKNLCESQSLKKQLLEISDWGKKLETEKLELLEKYRLKVEETFKLGNENSALRNDLNFLINSKFWKVFKKYYNFKGRTLYCEKPKENLHNLNKTEKKEEENIVINEKKEKIDLGIVETTNEKIISKKHRIFFLSIIDYNFRHQRPQHLAKFLADENQEVLYFNVNFNKEEKKEEFIDTNLELITLREINGKRIYDLRKDEDYNEIISQIDEIINNEVINLASVIVEYPSWYPIAKYLKEKYGFKIIFDYLDDFSGFNTDTPELPIFSDKMFEISDKVVATSSFLYEKAEKKSLNIDMVRNGTEFEHFYKAYSPKNKNKRPRIGYYGAIAEWFDMEKIEYIAKKNPKWDIELIGDYHFANIKKISKLENVYLLGEKKYQDLPKYLEKYDVCLIPFKADIDLIKATNPVKFYEYLSAGKKIVATEIPELLPYKDKFVYLANDNKKFEEYIKLCIEGKDDLANPKEMLDFAKTQDWQKRCNLFNYSIKSTFKKASIIVVTYNNLEYTKECIESIKKHTTYPNYEIIIVDNLSSDKTPEYLKSLEKEENIKVILNDENTGFAKGNNIGIKESSGDYIVLLNNDTVVTTGWLGRFVDHLDKNQELGLLCPVTNSIGNEAQINTGYETIEEMHKFAQEYTSKNYGGLYKKIPVLAMFCVAMTRQAFNEIGYLDETFGLGMFEDDDYSMRVRKAGYRLACCEDVFVHHYGSVSFKKLDDKKYKKIFQENKKKLEEKWGMEWQMHSYRPGITPNNSIK